MSYITKQGYSFYTDHLSIGYRRDYVILEDISIQINSGSLCALIGANGSGKSTFVKTIAGLIKPLSGKFYRAVGIRMSMVPQAKKIKIEYPLTVKKVLSLDMEASGFFFSRKEFEPNEMEILEKIGIDTILNYLIKECSGGQLQKVLLARSLLSGANLIFLDEPLDALDHQSQNNIFELIKEQSKQLDKTFFVITHNVHDSWMSNFDRFLVVEGKKISEVHNHVK
jgi:ABC-type Mn2+/Zn2+ transport system ATPase subunit